MEIITRQPAVNNFNRTDFNNAMPFVVSTDLVHTGGFSIKDYLSCNWCAHVARLCQTWFFNHRKSTRDAQTGRNFHRWLLPR
ncbi:hypothetical protein D3C75_1005590 [compost metagenome]